MPPKRVIVVRFDARSFTVRGIHSTKEIVIEPEGGEDVAMDEDCVGREHFIELEGGGHAGITHLHRITW